MIYKGLNNYQLFFNELYMNNNFFVLHIKV